jgi:hypothetical protein
MTARENRNPTFALIAAWLIVGLPGAWGVEQTLYKSFDLFHAPAPAVPVPATQPATAKAGAKAAGRAP